MILELAQLIWVTTPKGRARALFLIDYGPESDLQWVCAQATGEVWTWSNWDIRVADNITLGRENHADTRLQTPTDED